MRLIFWNTKHLDDILPICLIIEKKKPDIFYLGEYSNTIETKLNEYLESNNYEIIETPGCNRIRTIVNKTTRVELLTQDSYFSMQRIIENDDEINIVAVHLPSEMFHHADALKNFFRKFRSEIDSTVGDSESANVIVIGDFNVNPFESPLINFDGFRASNCRHARYRITHLGDEEMTYFNPTWKLFIRNDFPGTINYNRPSGYSFDILEWHYLDQVLLSNKLRDTILEDSIDVIEEIDNIEYLNKKTGKVVFSDHLPLIFSFRSH